jgi:hypothetical protein
MHSNGSHMALSGGNVTLAWVSESGQAPARDLVSQGVNNRL